MEELESSWFLNWILRGSIHDPGMGGSNHHPNWRFFESIEWYLSGRQIAHAADTLNTYCQLILGEILEIDVTAWNLLKPTLDKKSNLGRETAISLLKICRSPEGAVKKSHKEKLMTYWSPESDLILAARNKIVHQSGIDHQDEIPKIIHELRSAGGTPIKPPDLIDLGIPISLDSDKRLIIDASSGYWATRHIQHHIHLMDQHLTHRFDLMRSRWRPNKKTFYSTETDRALPFLPGTPLPTEGPPPPEETPCYTTTEPIQYQIMKNQKELECAQIWMNLYPQINDFITDYCQEHNIRIRSTGVGRAGTPRSDTIMGHDIHLDYGLEGSGDFPRGHLGIRLRQDNFEPFITVWGSNSQMVDFKCPSFEERIKETIRDYIDKASSR